jgi:hypothetical protein
MSEVRAAYIQKAREAHPDTNHGAESAKVRFQQIQDAYDKMKRKEPEPEFEITELQHWKNHIGGALKSYSSGPDVEILWLRLKDDVASNVVVPDMVLVRMLVQLGIHARNTGLGLWLLKDAATLHGFSPHVLLHGYNTLLELSEGESRADIGYDADEMLHEMPPASFQEILESLEAAGLHPDDHTNMIVTSWARLQWRCI